MVGVRLQDVDELHRVYWELRWVTYLQQLAQKDEENGSIAEQGAIVDARAHLLERQAQSMARLKSLLEKEDFYVPLKEE